jgi:hypothetical protein
MEKIKRNKKELFNSSQSCELEESDSFRVAAGGRPFVGPDRFVALRQSPVALRQRTPTHHTGGPQVDWHDGREHPSHLTHTHTHTQHSITHHTKTHTHMCM